MKDLKLTELPVRHVVALYGVYLLARAITSIFDADFAARTFESAQQGDVYGLQFSYIAGTILHPIVFAYLSVEFCKQTLPRWFALLVIVSHVFASIIATSYTFVATHGCQSVDDDLITVGFCVKQFLKDAQLAWLGSTVTMFLVVVVGIFSLIVLSKKKLFFKVSPTDETDE